jgi:phosphoribosylaminoimidazolecarboxamide formyltransferase/IMP cyclohydrolase
MRPIQRALISVTDKTGVVEFARGLAARGVEILSTGGTADLLRNNGVAVVLIADYTGFPEMMDGRIKTLHPKIHGGILARRSLDSHRQSMADHGIRPIDLVAINLYPFEATTARADCVLEEAVENIDIGGPAMIRSAAKNFEDVVVVVRPADYPEILREMGENGGAVTHGTRFRLSRDAFAATARYDSLIAEYFSRQVEPSNPFPRFFQYPFEKIQDLRYGENPHQAGAVYRDPRPAPSDVVSARQLQGKELSYNNYLDLNAVWELAVEFDMGAVVIVKHSNPCGVATGEDQLDVFIRARETDPVSAFGGVLGFNRTLTAATAGEILKNFVEVVVAPGYEAGALELFAAKKNVRVMEMPALPGKNSVRSADIRRIGGGILVQDVDRIVLEPARLKTVTRRAPSAEEMASLVFAWTVAKHVKSNAIVYARDGETVGIGAGQMSRVDSARVGIDKAQKPVPGCVMASDAFFPFRDSIDAAAKSGITAVIQPGGSIRDAEVIQAADEFNMSMVFTGIRHFRH